MIMAGKYVLEEDVHGKNVCSEEQPTCPVCSNSNLKVVGTRERQVWHGDGTKDILVIRQLRCRSCGRYHHELPGDVVPYKRYSAEVIEDIIEGKTDELYSEESTIRRIRAWWRTWKPYFTGVLPVLSVKYGAVFSASPTLREIVRAVVNAQLWPQARSAFLSDG